MSWKTDRFAATRSSVGSRRRRARPVRRTKSPASCGSWRERSRRPTPPCRRTCCVLAGATRSAASPRHLAGRPPGHHAPAAACGLRQHRQSAAGAGERPAPGNGGSSGARREAVARRAAAPDRKPRARPVWRGARRRHGGLGNAGVECVAADARARDPHLVRDDVDGTGLAVAMLLGIACAIVFGWPRRCSSRVSLRSTCARARTPSRAAGCGTS